MLDLCAGLKGWSTPFQKAGWDVVSLDIDPQFESTICADLRSVRSTELPGPWTLITFSPPCDEFARESMPWSRTGKAPSTELVQAGLRLIEELRPAYWVLENVRGSLPFIKPLLGPPVKRHGPFYLWGNFPPIDPVLQYRKKESFSSRRRVERALIPPNLSTALLRAVHAITESALAGDRAGAARVSPIPPGCF
jgi:hypothetical protein